MAQKAKKTTRKDPMEWVKFEGEYKITKLPPNQPDPGQLFKVGPTILKNLTEH